MEESKVRALTAEEIISVNTWIFVNNDWSNIMLQYLMINQRRDMS